MTDTSFTTSSRQERLVLVFLALLQLVLPALAVLTPLLLGGGVSDTLGGLISWLILPPVILLGGLGLLIVVVFTCLLVGGLLEGRGWAEKTLLSLSVVGVCLWPLLVLPGWPLPFMPAVLTVVTILRGRRKRRGIRGGPADQSDRFARTHGKDQGL